MKYKKHYPFTRIGSLEGLLGLSKKFRPDILHCHYLHYIDIVYQAAMELKVPFTVRTHSFDIIQKGHDFIQSKAEMVNHELCRGMLVFPFLIDRCRKAGMKPEKLFPAMPVVDFNRFYDPSPNGSMVLNTGAAIPKKNMESFLEMSLKLADKKFLIVPIGYDTAELQEKNKALGHPVKIRKTVEPDVMPRIYKKSEWLVYTANSEMASVGWPMAIDEARASGVGVLMQNIRSDIKDYIDGVGYTFDSIDEAVEIVKGPVPKDLRERGFDIAKRSDIGQNISQLILLCRFKKVKHISRDFAYHETTS